MTNIKHLSTSLIQSIVIYADTGKWRLKDAFNLALEGQAKSQTFRRIWRDAYGDEYPEEADPNSFVTMTSLRCIAKYLSIVQGQTLVDLGCGRGGPGLWVARETDANLAGIDISDVAVEYATQRIADFGLNERAQFRVGNFCATGLPNASYDGAMSVDSLISVTDKSAAVREVARILRPGARFVFTTWETDKLKTPLIVKDHRPFLGDAGFEVEVYDEMSGWEQSQRDAYEAVLATKDALIEEMGRAAAKQLIKEAERMLPRLDQVRRILVVARKRLNSSSNGWPDLNTR